MFTLALRPARYSAWLAAVLQLAEISVPQDKT
jgi:hypothetical protein